MKIIVVCMENHKNLSIHDCKRKGGRAYWGLRVLWVSNWLFLFESFLISSAVVANTVIGSCQMEVSVEKSSMDSSGLNGL